MIALWIDQNLKVSTHPQVGMNSKISFLQLSVFTGKHGCDRRHQKRFQSLSQCAFRGFTQRRRRRQLLVYTRVAIDQNEPTVDVGKGLRIGGVWVLFLYRVQRCSQDIASVQVVQSVIKDIQSDITLALFVGRHLVIVSHIFLWHKSRVDQGSDAFDQERVSKAGFLDINQSIVVR